MFPHALDSTRGGEGSASAVAVKDIISDSTANLSTLAFSINPDNMERDLRI